MRTDEFRALIAGLETQGLSKAEIARQTNPPMSRATLWRYLNGNSNHLETTFTRVERLARRYGVAGAGVSRGKLIDR
jgi:hypothetical protein